MKKAVSFAAVICIICFLTCLTSCEEILAALNDSSETSGDTWSYSNTETGRVHELPSGQHFVTISNLPVGKTLYLTKTNVTATSMPGIYARYITGATGIDLISANFSAANRSAQNSGSSDEPDSMGIFVQEPRFKYFTPPDISELESASRTSAPSADTSNTAVTKIEHKVGSTANIYIDNNSSISSYSEHSATIRAVGTYCNVWVVDDYYSTTASSSASSDSIISASSSIPSDYASFFDTMYPMITNVFGDESNVMDDGSSLSSASPTEEYINIVLYDIGGGDSSSGQVLGYFHNKDYMSNCSISNIGKYFYIDSYYANKELSMTYSTLAHEFQHMVDYNTKNIEHGITPSTWWNEMMSMLCEDMMQSNLGITDTDSPKGRLPSFNMYNSYVGIEYRENETSGGTVIPYATAYAFGCWLARNFGGAALVQKMSTNAYVDYDCVVKAVNEINGTSYTFADLMRMYTESLIFSDTSLSMPTFNKKAAQTITYAGSSYTYPMTAVNLWDSAYEWMVKTSDVASYPYNTTNGTGTYTQNGTNYDVTYLLGPQMFGYDEANAIRSYGIKLCKVGTITKSTVTITFNEPLYWEGEHVYLMVQ